MLGGGSREDPYAPDLTVLSVHEWKVSAVIRLLLVVAGVMDLGRVRKSRTAPPTDGYQLPRLRQCSSFRGLRQCSRQDGGRGASTTLLDNYANIGRDW